MPLLEPPALSADETRKLLARLPGVQNTGANLSKYREPLLLLARRTDSWLGLLAPDAPTPTTASNAFYPLARVGRSDLPIDDKTGRLHDVLFLKNSRFIYDNVLVANGQARRPPLVLVRPVTLPYEDCPVLEQNAPPCDHCEWWAHCATGKKPWAELIYIGIHAFHYMKCAKVDDVWCAAGDSVARISFRYPGATPNGASVKLTYGNGELYAVPQFQYLLS